jgi:hypothetical protein
VRWQHRRPRLFTLGFSGQPWRVLTKARSYQKVPYCTRLGGQMAARQEHRVAVRRRQARFGQHRLLQSRTALQRSLLRIAHQLRCLSSAQLSTHWSARKRNPPVVPHSVDKETELLGISSIQTPFRVAREGY